MKPVEVWIDMDWGIDDMAILLFLSSDNHLFIIDWQGSELEIFTYILRYIAVLGQVMLDIVDHSRPQSSSIYRWYYPHIHQIFSKLVERNHQLL